MTDRELLINAAKAAGVETYCVLGNTIMKMTGIGNTLAPWDPLTDDGAALRLAIDLELDVMVASVKSVDYSLDLTIEAGTDVYAATRRTIVRAAAEIGKALK